MSAELIDSVLAFAMGFAVARLIVSGRQLMICRPATFELLQRGTGATRIAAVPLFALTAPFIIMRNTMRARQLEKGRLYQVMVGTIVAGCWTLVSGTVIVMVLTALGIPAG